MKLESMAASAVLAFAMMFGADVAPAEAGDKKSKQRIHVSPNIKPETLRKAAKTLKGEHKNAVLHEANRREHPEKLAKRRARNDQSMGEFLAKHDPVIGLWAVGVSRGRKGGH